MTTARPVSWSAEACEDWTARYDGVAPGGRIGKALKPLVGRVGWLDVRPAWRAYLAETDGQYASPERFAATFGRWKDGPARPALRGNNESVMREFLARRKSPAEPEALVLGWKPGSAAGK